MALFLACNDAFRTCSPPEEYFDYGLWMPLDELSERNQSERNQSARSLPIAIQTVANDQQRMAFQTKFGKKATIQQIAIHARETGIAPSLAELGRLHEKCGDNVSFEDYMTFRRQIAHNEDTEEHLLTFFKSYDTQGDGNITRKQLKNMLMNYGEPLTEVEAEAIMRESNITGDVVNYNDLVRNLLK